MKRNGLRPDVFEPAPKRGGDGPYKLKTLARLLGLGEELESRLQVCSDETTVPARALVFNAVRAAVEAIEANQYRVMLPMQFGLRSTKEKNGLPPISSDLLETEPGTRATGFIELRENKRRRGR